MKKLKVGVIFGGLSSEHDISIESAKSIIDNLDNNKYDIHNIYIDKLGNWYKYNIKSIIKIKNIVKYLKEFDIIFPVLHGMYGEDGTIQGLLEMIDVPYVGCKVLSSSICMDKIYTKKLLELSNIKQVKYLYFKYEKNNYIYVDDDFNEITMNRETLLNKIVDELKFPMYIKPSRQGSSIGITKANTIDELSDSIKIALEYDNKIIIEQGIIARELEIGVLDKNVSIIGEIITDEEFYSYNSKYKNNTSKTIIPANLMDEQINEIKSLALKVFNILSCNALARIDFFIDKETNEIYVNEINTMPGFTDISMYPKLFIHDGMSFTDLLDRIIEISLNNE